MIPTRARPGPVCSRGDEEHNVRRIKAAVAGAGERERIRIAGINGLVEEVDINVPGVRKDLPQTGSEVI